MVTVLDSKIASALIAERRRLNKHYETLENMLKYMDLEDIEKVLSRQSAVHEQLVNLEFVMGPLN
jgi:hypothetical protein